MKYYVVADIHGYYTEFQKSLDGAGYFRDKEAHKLIICGDLFDRGEEACKLQDFIVDIMSRDEVILIRGNHEDLMLSMIADWDNGSYQYSHHRSNGTVSTALQLTGCNDLDLFDHSSDIKKILLSTPYLSQIIPAMQNYYETKHKIFVHGWIPCKSFKVNAYATRYESIENWRSASADEWTFARWINGMAAAHDGVVVAGKEIVCGHWHCSFGHYLYEGNGSELGPDADFSPYKAKGVIAIDGCTAVSKKVNCIIIEE